MRLQSCNPRSTAMARCHCRILSMCAFRIYRNRRFSRPLCSFTSLSRLNSLRTRQPRSLRSRWQRQGRASRRKVLWLLFHRLGCGIFSYVMGYRRREFYSICFGSPAHRSYRKNCRLDAQGFLDVDSLYSELDICSLAHKFTLQLQLFTIEYCYC